MLTKEQIKDGASYQWHTDYHLNTIYDSLNDLLDNEIGDDINVLDVFDNNVIVMVNENEFIINVVGDGDFCSHIAHIESLIPNKED